MNYKLIQSHIEKLQTNGEYIPYASQYLKVVSECLDQFSSDGNNIIFWVGTHHRLLEFKKILQSKAPEINPYLADIITLLLIDKDFSLAKLKQSLTVIDLVYSTIKTNFNPKFDDNYHKALEIYNILDTIFGRPNGSLREKTENDDLAENPYCLNDLFSRLLLNQPIGICKPIKYFSTRILGLFDIDARDVTTFAKHGNQWGEHGKTAVSIDGHYVYLDRSGRHSRIGQVYQLDRNTNTRFIDERYEEYHTAVLSFENALAELLYSYYTDTRLSANSIKNNQDLKEIKLDKYFINRGQYLILKDINLIINDTALTEKQKKELIQLIAQSKKDLNIDNLVDLQDIFHKDASFSFNFSLFRLYYQNADDANALKQGNLIWESYKDIQGFFFSEHSWDNYSSKDFTRILPNHQFTLQYLSSFLFVKNLSRNDLLLAINIISNILKAVKNLKAFEEFGIIDWYNRVLAQLE